MCYLKNDNTGQIVHLTQISPAQFGRKCLINNTSCYYSSINVSSSTVEQASEQHRAGGYREISERTYLESLEHMIQKQLQSIKTRLILCPKSPTVDEIFDIAA